MTTDDIIKKLRDMARYPTVTLPRDCEALSKAADLLEQAALEAKDEPVVVCEPWLLESTQNLAKHMAKEFYPEVTQWEVLNDLAGVISQIDNMTTGLIREPQPKAEQK